MQVGDAGQTTGGRGVSDVVLKIDSARIGMGGRKLEREAHDKSRCRCGVESESHVDHFRRSHHVTTFFGVLSSRFTVVSAVD
jgi:hypothetical protein